jgi:hypothetical protein
VSAAAAGDIAHAGELPPVLARVLYQDAGVERRAPPVVVAAVGRCDAVQPPVAAWGKSGCHGPRATVATPTSFTFQDAGLLEQIRRQFLWAVL